MTVSASTQFALIQDRKTNGTASGAITSGSWVDRDLNTSYDPWGFVTSLSANAFTLPAGSYWIQAIAPSFACYTNQIRIRDTTNNVTLGVGTSEYSTDSGGSNSGSSAIAECYVTLTAPTTLKIQHRCSITRAGNGLGVATSFGTQEVFTSVAIRKAPNGLVASASARTLLASGTNGGTATSGSWFARTLNSGDLGATDTLRLSNTRDTLWLVTGDAIGFQVSAHRVRLYDYTASSYAGWNSNDFLGVAAYSGSGASANDTSAKAYLHALVKTFANVSKDIQLHHRVQSTRAADGLGVAQSYGQEVYANLVAEGVPAP